LRKEIAELNEKNLKKDEEILRLTKCLDEKNDEN